MSELEEAQNAAGHLAHSRVARFWLKELPYIAVLALTILGVAYTSVSQQPLIGYWEFLAVAIGLVCVTTGWLHIHDPNARFYASPPLAGLLDCDEHSAYAQRSKNA